MRRTIIALIIMAYGSMLLLKRMGIFDFDWFFQINWHLYLWPVIIIFVGFMILIGGKHEHRTESSRVKNVYPEPKEGEVFTSSVFCCGGRYNFQGQHFYGAKLSASLGGMTLDLRGADIDEGAAIEVSTFMGGVEIFADANVKFIVQGSCLLGGVDNKTTVTSSLDSKTIVLKANCFMGGVEIK